MVAPDGTVRHLDRDAFTVDVTARWTSPATGADYPAGWTLRIPGDDLVIDLRPTVADQELDTRPTTGVVYWEGSQVVRATRGGTTARRRGLCRADGICAHDAGRRPLRGTVSGPASDPAAGPLAASSRSTVAASVRDAESTSPSPTRTACIWAAECR